jgi:hypothetical protein
MPRGGARKGAGRPSAGPSVTTSTRWTGAKLEALDACRADGETRAAAVKRLASTHPDYVAALAARETP